MTIEGVDEAKGATPSQNAACAKEQGKVTRAHKGKVTHGYKRASGNTVSSAAATTGKELRTLH
jgi:hypothetical protein